MLPNSGFSSSDGLCTSVISRSGARCRYLETLEVTQDVGRIRALEGERRLLEYHEPALVGPQ
jgi:hypothetical protein